LIEQTRQIPSTPNNNSDLSTKIQQNVEGDGNQVIGQVTGGNVFNIAGNVNILSSKSIAQTTPQIDWLDRSYQLLTAQKHLTTNGLLKDSTRNFDHIHVSLGLIERKERPKVKEEPSPERGSEFYQTEYTETKRFEHQAFLADVVGDRVAGKHIAIIGEPGAGKTTILTKIGEYLIRQAEQQPEQPFVVAWVSLAAVGDRPLQKYLQAEWLQKVCEDDFEAAWQEWRVLRQQGRVWLLLDGLDEMSGDALGSIYRDLGQAWAQNLRVAMTCRINQWEAAAGGNILTNSFDVYRTLDYSYQTSQGEDQVEKFISNWFGDKEKEVANQIRRELDAPGKERIKDLVKNPLRLTLLCVSWEQDNQALPETQADLYQGFVNYLYGWKAKEFQEEVKLKDKLNLALGELAKAGLNRTSINDGAVRRFRFTASEIRELWQDLPDTLLPAAEKLGWLNVVGKEKKEDLYAFYHPTFQEYFAACSIDDWDYFLPKKHEDRPVRCQDETVPTYRVFEKQWQQVIVFWIGRNFDKEYKEDFLVKLTNFRDETSEFYYYQAYCVAAICVGEFQSSQYAESIVQTVVRWAFGYFDPNEQEWVNLERVNSAFVSSILPLTQRKYLIISLLSYIFQDDLPYEATLLMDSIHTRLHAISVLGKIAKGNKKAIEDLTSFIYKTDGYLLSITAAEALGTIDIGSRLAITVMITFLCQPSSTKYDVISFVFQCLRRISIGNESVIQELLYILSQLRNTDDCRQSMIVDALSYIAIGNTETLDILISMLQSNPVFPLSHNIADALVQIASNNEDAIKMINSNFSGTIQNKDIEPYVSRILRDINSNNQREAISLHNLFLDSKIDFFHMKEVLKTIEIGDKQTTKELSAIILDLNTDNPKFFLAAHTLGRIDVGNKLAITTLLTIISQSDLDDYSLLEIVHSLREIALGNREVIERLMDFLSKPNLSDILRHSIAYTLWNIDIGNNKAITTLLDLISRPESDNSLPMGTGEDMNEIITIDLMPMVVSKLKYQVQTDMCESNDKKFYICKTVMWKCAQALPYHEFYSAWHQN
jgi:NACHT domain